MICPLLYAGANAAPNNEAWKERPAGCQEGACSLWDTDAQACAMWTIATELRAQRILLEKLYAALLRRVS